MASGIGPGTQSRVAPIPLFLGNSLRSPSFSEFDRGADPVDTQMYVTSQLAIAVPLGLIAFLTFCVLRTKWSHFYMSLWRGRGSHIRRPRSGWLTCVVIQAGNYQTWETACFRGFRSCGRSRMTKSWKLPDSTLMSYNPREETEITTVPRLL